MTLIVVRNSNGYVVAFGPSNGSYLPTIPAGCTSAVEINPVLNFPPPSPEELRLAELDNIIITDSVISDLKAMTNSQFDTWWSANVTNLSQANTVLKRIARLVIRRVL